MKKTRAEYCYADPAGNITILVETVFPAADYPEIASRLLDAEPDAEQVGFIEGLSPAEYLCRWPEGSSAEMQHFLLPLMLQ